jgi:SAM-dependent methyltransferase
MRLGIIPEGIIDRIALASGKLPTPIVETFWGIALGRLIITGAQLGVFDALTKGEKTVQEIAEYTKCNSEGMETLLDALNGFGYLARRDGRYSLNKKSRKWLTKTSSSSMYDAIMFMSELWRMMEGMEQTIKSGEATNLHYADKPPEFWERYMRGLATFAKYAGPEIVRKVPLRIKPKRLLDVGGGHAAYSMAFCRKYPELKAEVLDLPSAVEQGRKIVKEQGFEDRVSFREGDLREAEWGEGYDLVLLFNVIHNVSVEEAGQAMAKAYQALKPKGTFVVLDSEHVGGKDNLSATSGFNELLFFLLSSCRAYPEESIREWVTNAGFTKLRKKKLLAMPMTLLLIGERE